MFTLGAFSPHINGCKSMGEISYQTAEEEEGEWRKEREGKLQERERGEVFACTWRFVIFNLRSQDRLRPPTKAPSGTSSTNLHNLVYFCQTISKSNEFANLRIAKYLFTFRLFDTFLGSQISYVFSQFESAQTS